MYQVYSTKFYDVSIKNAIGNHAAGMTISYLYDSYFENTLFENCHARFSYGALIIV